MNVDNKAPVSSLASVFPHPRDAAQPCLTPPTLSPHTQYCVSYSKMRGERESKEPSSAVVHWLIQHRQTQTDIKTESFKPSQDAVKFKLKVSGKLLYLIDVGLEKSYVMV